MGMGTATAQAQHIAARLGAAARQGHFRIWRHRACRAASSPADRRRPRRSGRRHRRDRGARRGVCSSSPATIRRSRGFHADDVEMRAMAGCAIATPDRFESYVSILRRAGARRAGVRGGSAAAARDGGIFDALLRRAILRGRVSAVTGEDARVAFPRLVRLRAHPQPQDRDQPVQGRHHHGASAWR
jgi:hypothetical protein